MVVNTRSCNCKVKFVISKPKGRVSVVDRNIPSALSALKSLSGLAFLLTIDEDLSRPIRIAAPKA